MPLVLPILVLLLAAALRLYGLGTQALWLDEALSWHTVSAPDLLATILPNNTPPLYYAILKAWVAVFGDSRSALRLLSAVEGTLYVGVCMWWASILFTGRVALWSGLWAAVSPMAIYYSQEARAYAQLTLLLALAYACVSKAAKSDRIVWWASAAMAATAALYTHYLAAISLVFCAALVAARPSRAAWRGAAGAGLGAALALAPWVVAALTARRPGSSGFEWIAALWEQTSPALAIPHSLEVLGLGGDLAQLQVKFRQPIGAELPPALRFLGIGGLVALGAIALWRDDERDATRWKWALVALVIGPLALLWSLSWWRPLYVVGRYDQIAMPAYPLLLALACSRLQSWRGAVGAALAAMLLLAPIGWRLVLYYDAPTRDLEERAAALLDARARNGDVVIFTELRALPALYELSRRGYAFSEAACTNAARDRRLACRAYPREWEQLQALSNNTAPDGGEAQIAATAADFADDRAGDDNSVWIVLGRYRVTKTRLAATPISADLLHQLQQAGLAPVSADIEAGVLEYRAATP